MDEEKLSIEKLSVNSQAWNEIFNTLNIVENVNEKNYFEISASKIKEITNREARLMTKFDWSASLPQVFQDNKLVILPNSRGSYVIGRFEAYHNFSPKPIKSLSTNMPTWMETFDHFDITSESVALNVAQASGMIDYVMDNVSNEFEINEPHAESTLTGRMKSESISYIINMSIPKLDQDGCPLLNEDNTTKYIKSPNKFDFTVNNSQIEIDASYETMSKLAVIEAKQKNPFDFMTRQLYYPYRRYKMLGIDKEILPIYFTYVDKVFSFSVYKFNDVNNYSSISLMKQIDFILDDSDVITLDTVQEISAKSKMLDEPDDLVYPQANTLKRVFELVDILDEPKNKFELAVLYGFNDRQGDYYGNAATYLGFVKKSKDKFELTPLGENLRKLPSGHMRNVEMIKKILDHKTFKLSYDFWYINDFKTDEKFKKYVEKTIFELVPNINQNTVERRGQTLRAWLKWIFSVTE
ncbi:hypothetical protein FC70_GL001486 [Paucilactobacillus oligofermentans DSM 15707 = LMG 22743]|uniref:Uncharacterized protein n=1 Tax=Paucilactobacillus oligofermentans DSM 15707 = LMG 22743 TaxID=1423778 RepID=A0A0R1RCK9_9LACO|nr:hypothetical protein [Paucilactobacillus oligofermentans]KRL54687.1 hypothetical protein FC70_GL001486 [Paucilactobacillus oligofermentans DSM 15707 = LMG 22743]CUS26402.1 Type II DNA restriction-modification system endonuclease [Paucilactobacillus oligofermentans DSM 15707 = LMG 22743]